MKTPAERAKALLEHLFDDYSGWPNWWEEDIAAAIDAAQAEALPSQTSGAEAFDWLRQQLDIGRCGSGRYFTHPECETLFHALAKPASEPVSPMEKATADEDSGLSEIAVQRQLSSPASSPEADRISGPQPQSSGEAEALQAGVEADEVKRIQDWLLERNREHLYEKSHFMVRPAGEAERFLDAAILLSKLVRLSSAPAQEDGSKDREKP